MEKRTTREVLCGFASPYPVRTNAKIHTFLVLYSKFLVAAEIPYRRPVIVYTCKDKLSVYYDMHTLLFLCIATDFYIPYNPLSNPGEIICAVIYSSLYGFNYVIMV